MLGPLGTLEVHLSKSLSRGWYRFLTMARMTSHNLLYSFVEVGRLDMIILHDMHLVLGAMSYTRKAHTLIARHWVGERLCTSFLFLLTRCFFNKEVLYFPFHLSPPPAQISSPNAGSFEIGAGHQPTRNTTRCHWPVARGTIFHWLWHNGSTSRES